MAARLIALVLTAAALAACQGMYMAGDVGPRAGSDTQARPAP